MYPGGWFEFDVAVPTDAPFAVRVVETFDGATLKTYDVSADGVTVLSQSLRRTAGGQGTMTYQFVIDEPEVTADGRVRLRFQDVDRTMTHPSPTCGCCPWAEVGPGRGPGEPSPGPRPSPSGAPVSW